MSLPRQIRLIFHHLKRTKNTDRLYPSELIDNFDLEQRLEKKLNELNSFNNSINNLKESITYFKYKNNKSKKKYKNVNHYQQK